MLDNLEVSLMLINVTSSNLEYMATPIIYEFIAKNEDMFSMELVNIEKLFLRNQESEVILLKLLHDICMLKFFGLDFLLKNGGVRACKLKPNMYMKLLVKAEDVNIVAEKGFSLFGMAYRVDYVSEFLLGITGAIFKFLVEKQQVEEYHYLKRLIDFKDKIGANFNIDEIVAKFISENMDIYEKYKLKENEG